MAKKKKPADPEIEQRAEAVKQAKEEEQTAIHALGVASGKRRDAEAELAKATEAAAEKAAAEKTDEADTEQE